MAFFKGIGNAFGTVGGVFAAPFDGGKLMNESAAATEKHFTTVGKDIGDGFSKDGAVTKFFEDTPVAGYVAASVHAIAGNESHAKRAAAKSTSATVAAAVVVGTGMAVVATGGGAAVVIGAAAAAGAAGTAAGGGVQVAIEATYNDEDVKVVGQEQTNKTAGQWLGEATVGGAFAAVTCGAGIAGSNATRHAAKSVAKEAPKKLVDSAAKSVAGGAGKAGSNATQHVAKSVATKSVEASKMLVVQAVKSAEKAPAIYAKKLVFRDLKKGGAAALSEAIDA